MKITTNYESHGLLCGLQIHPMLSTHAFENFNNDIYNDL